MPENIKHTTIQKDERMRIEVHLVTLHIVSNSCSKWTSEKCYTSCGGYGWVCTWGVLEGLESSCSAWADIKSQNKLLPTVIYTLQPDVPFLPWARDYTQWYYNALSSSRSSFGICEIAQRQAMTLLLLYAYNVALHKQSLEYYLIHVN